MIHATEQLRITPAVSCKCASVCACVHVRSRMAQGPVCDVNTGRVNTLAAHSLHCYYPVCIISLINRSHQRRCPMKYSDASVPVKENGAGGTLWSPPPTERRWASVVLCDALCCSVINIHGPIDQFHLCLKVRQISVAVAFIACFLILFIVTRLLLCNIICALLCWLLVLPGGYHDPKTEGGQSCYGSVCVYFTDALVSTNT